MIIYVDFRRRPNLRADNPILGFMVAGLLSLPVWALIWAWTCWLFS